MNTYIISYDITNDAQAPAVRERLYCKIKEYGIWAHITESLWAIKSDKPAVAIRDELMTILRPIDRLIVIQSSHVAAWHNVLCHNEWLKENI